MRTFLVIACFTVLAKKTIFLEKFITKNGYSVDIDYNSKEEKNVQKGYLC